MEDLTTSHGISFTENLERLENILDCEYRALLDGDSKTVATLAVEKERIANALNGARAELTDEVKLSAEIQRLARRVEELAKLNHLLLKQMYQHYHGMLELFMRIGGKSRTYGKNGIMTIESPPDKDGEILA